MRKAMLALSATLAVTLVAGILGPVGALAAEPRSASAEDEKDYIEVVEELDWVTEKTEDPGTGLVQKNKTYNGQPLTVNYKTYDRNSLGMHVAQPTDPNPERDVVYDISAYSEEYPLFHCYVGQPDDGNNIIEYTILTSSEEGPEQIVDRVTWRHKALPDDDSQPVLTMRAYVKGAKYLILRYKCAHSDWGNGSCAFLDVRLNKASENTLPAVNLMHRWDAAMTSQTTGDNSANPEFGAKIFYDADINGGDFSHMENSDYTSIYETFSEIGYQQWLSMHLINIPGGNGSIAGSGYAVYEQNKSDTSKYLYIKWDITDMNFTYFSALGYDGAGYGFHADIWIDGEEVYKSGWIKSIATVNATPGFGNTRNAPQEIGCAIPAEAKSLELRIIADTIHNTGGIRILEPTFFKSDATKLSHYPAVQEAGRIWDYETVRGRTYDGRQTAYYDADTQTDVTVDDGFFFIAGDATYDPGKYTFDLTNLGGGNTLIANVGRGAQYNKTGAPVTLHYKSYKKGVDEEDELLQEGETEPITWENSGEEVMFYLGDGATKLEIWATADHGSDTETILANGHFVTKHVVTLDYMDGETKEVLLYDEGAELTQPDTPTRPGYDFKEWQLQGEDAAYDFSGKTVTEDITLEAQWTLHEYTITYKQQKDAAEATDLTIADAPATYTVDKDVTLPAAPEIANYTFKGWYVNDVKLAENKLAAGAYTADITVIAKYEIDTVTVTFYNGTEEAGTAEVVVGQAIADEQLPDVTKDGYDLAGWQTKDSETYTDYVLTTPVTGELALYAKWTPKTFTIVYKQQLGDGEATAVSGYTPTTHTYDTATTLPAAKTVEGYAFDGWYRNDIKITEIGAQDITGGTEIVIVAKYVRATYKVEYYDGDDKLGEETVEHGETITEEAVDVPAKTGYDFTGWQTKDGDTYADYDKTDAVTSALKLYAKYTAKSYAITYKHQLGSAAAVDATGYTPTAHTYGTATTLPAAQNVTGYEFVGWYVGEEKVTELGATAYIADITVTARYRVATVTVTFVTGEGESEPLEYEYGATIGDKVAEKEGQTFEGWYLDEACTQKYDASTALNGDLTLYAKWASQGGGCGGVISATAGVIAALVVAGACAVVLFRKKREK